MGLLALLLGIVVAFQRVELPLVIPDGFKFFDQRVGLALGRVDLAVVAGDASTASKIRIECGATRARPDSDTMSGT